MKKVWILVALAGPLSAQVATEANTQYRSPDGRQSVAANLSAPDRDERVRFENHALKAFGPADSERCGPRLRSRHATPVARFP